jgi:hypothetical protein
MNVCKEALIKIGQTSIENGIEVVSVLLSTQFERVARLVTYYLAHFTYLVVIFLSDKRSSYNFSSSDELDS